METNRLGIISEILNEKFDFTDDGVLEEDGFDDRGRRFSMVRKIVCNPRTIRYKLYRIDQPGINLFPYFKETSELRRICDYILFAEDDEQIYVFAIELKKGASRSRKQLQAAKIFIKYVIESAQRIGYEFDKFNIRTIRICEAAKYKKGTRENPIEYIDDHMDYRYHHFRLEPLMC